MFNIVSTHHWLKSRVHYKSRMVILSGLMSLVLFHTAIAGEFDSSIPMRDKGASTYYVPCNIEGYGSVDMMVDTGSSYMTINENALRVLKAKGRATYVKQLDAKMADGSRMIVPVYRLTMVNLGGRCRLHNIEAAVLPGASRPLLGLSVLNKAGPFIFSTNPPRLTLSHCTDSI